MQVFRQHMVHPETFGRLTFQRLNLWAAVEARPCGADEDGEDTRTNHSISNLDLLLANTAAGLEGLQNDSRTSLDDKEVRDIVNHGEGRFFSKSQ